MTSVLKYTDISVDTYTYLMHITVTLFMVTTIKVRSFEIMTYSRPFNFAVSYHNYFTVSYTNVVFSYTN